MRPLRFVIAALLLAATFVAAQNPQNTQNPQPTAPPGAKPNPVLDKVLANWEASMARVKFLTAELACIEKDKTFNQTMKSTGFAQYLKAGEGTTSLNLANLETKTEGKKDLRYKFTSTGTYLYEFRPAIKEIVAHELPKPKPGAISDDNFMSFLFGMKAEDAKKRYDMRLSKEDAYYFFIDVSPRTERDRADFAKAQIVIDKRNYYPRQLWFEEVNGRETTWDIPRIDDRTPVDRRNFDAPKPPGSDWKIKVEKLTAEGPPKTIRP